MNILFITQTLSLGGTEKHITNILPSLIKQNHNITLLILRKKYDEKLLELLKQSNVRVLFLNKTNVFENIFIQSLRRCFVSFNISFVHDKLLNKKIISISLHLKKFILLNIDIVNSIKILLLIRKLNIDTLVTFNNRTNRINHLVSKTCKIKTIISKRGENYGFDNYQYLRAIKYNFADAIIVNSLEFKVQLMKMGVAQQKINLIYSGVPKFKKNPTFITQKKINIVYLANFREVKDHITFIRSIKYLEKSINQKDWEVYCIGSDKNSYLKYLIDYAKKLDINYKINWILNPSNIQDYLSMAHIAVHTSRSEGLANSILELMSMGLPIISTKVGAHNDIIKDKINGFLVNQGDYYRISKLLYLLINNKKMRVQIGKQSYENYKNNFTLEECVFKYNSIIENLKRH